MKLKGILLSVYLAAFAFGCAKEPDPVKVAPNGKLMTCESIVHASQTPTYTYKNAPKMESPYSTISESRYAAAPTVTNQICSTPAPAVTSTSSAGTVTIIGHAEYVDKVFSPTTYLGTNLLPIRYAVVEIVERSSGNILATTSTDGAGDYIVTFTYAGGIAYVRILAQLNSRYNGKVLYTDKSQYSVASVAKTISAGEAWTINLCTGADNAGPAFNILDNILNAQIVANSFSTKPTEELVAYWQVGNSSGTSYSKDINSGQHTIQILGTTSDPDEYDDSVLLHEMGHYVAAVYSQDNSDGGPHSFNGHYDLRLAWSEGWASFFQGLIKAENGLPYPEYYLDTDGTTPRTSLEIETPGTTAIEKYKGNGATTNFNTLFKFPDNSNVHVILVDALGVKIPQVENTDYTLSGAGVATGGTVSMVTPPALDEALIIFGIGLFNMPLSISADNELSVAAFLWDVYDAPTTGEAAVNDDD
ncbi:MAG: hypothetical protein OEY64_12865, partial [Nitrospinota bacterium]|nr:hypothetical protein [Nitrospinota bacterium]